MRGVRGGACRGAARGIQSDEEGKQEVAGDVATGERARDTHGASRREEEDRGGGGLASWAAQLGLWAAQGAKRQVGFPFLFLFYFSDICFDLVILLKHFIYLCQFL